MTVSDRALKMVGVTLEEYKKWCFDHDKPSYKRAVWLDFMARINDGRICRDKVTRKLVDKHSIKVSSLQEDLSQEEERNENE